ncbi:ArsA-related P-loop ATPase [Mucilaginibacter aquariorum]|uniref:arsenite-transporting ATPase n=1 Tax=Mucilaginibacter aquariorum TaxID=2967225 RepID=A0ABT1T3W8_9SPHI|nr:ArsA-related P-loop ATPase [Mucilaginibacter aquariorum]MCQ6959298.1 AAA family ATPase [Mucilaginibacter aquariorum]
MEVTKIIEDCVSRFLFFIDKCGVGKTTLACANAVVLTEKGKNVLFISISPVFNLADSFGQSGR